MSTQPATLVVDIVSTSSRARNKGTLVAPTYDATWTPTWLLGTLFNTITPSSFEITTLLAIRKDKNWLYVIVLHPSHSNPICLDNLALQQMVKAYCATIDQVKQLSNQVDPLPLVPQRSGKKYTIRKLGSFDPGLLNVYT